MTHIVNSTPMPIELSNRDLQQLKRPNGIYTAEMILASSTKSRLIADKARCEEAGYVWPDIRRKPETCLSKVLTNEEVDAALQSEDADLLIHCGVTMISDEDAFFLTDDHMFGWRALPKKFMSCTIQIPRLTAAREGVPGGCIDTAEKICIVYCKDQRRLNTIEELVEYLNKNYF